MKETTPSYIVTIPLYPEYGVVCRMNRKFNAGVQIYNTLLREAVKRINRMKNDSVYRTLLRQFRETDDKNIKTEISSELSRIKSEFCISEYSLHEFSAGTSKYFRRKLGINEVQKLATRAFRTAEKLIYGKAHRICYVRQSDDFYIENKSNDTGLRLRERSDGYHIVWGKDIDFVIDVPKGDTYLQKTFFDRTKYVGIKRYKIRDRWCFMLYLIKEGNPPQKKHHPVIAENSVIGIDPGVSTMAVVSKDHVSLNDISVPEDETHKRVLMRKLDRQRRANNPDNYNADGTVKKGFKTWKKSNRQKATESRIREASRLSAIHRKEKQNSLMNILVNDGCTVVTERMSYKGLQSRSKNETINKKTSRPRSKKRFGKTLMNAAPSAFLDRLRYKVICRGGAFIEADTWRVKASQFDHISGKCIKKQLYERWGTVGGRSVQRDLYSAFLLMNVSESFDSVDIDRCSSTFSRFLELHDMEVKRIRENGKSDRLFWYVR